MGKGFVGIASLAGAILIGGIAWPVVRDEMARSSPPNSSGSPIAGHDAFAGKTAQAASATIPR